MRLTLLPLSETQKVHPQDAADYASFQRNHGSLQGTNELGRFERFYAARTLIGEGNDAYLDPEIAYGQHRTFFADVCGIRGNALTIVFCRTENVDSSLMSLVEIVSRSSNGRTVIIAPPEVDIKNFGKLWQKELENGRVSLEILKWFDNEFDRTLQDTLRLIDVLGNETRMRMLAPLFEKTAGTREMRTRINPKLVYENLSMLEEAGLVDEMEKGTYELSRFGKSMMAEFITFLEKTRKTLDQISRQKEVKHD